MIEGVIYDDTICDNRCLHTLTCVEYLLEVYTVCSSPLDLSFVLLLDSVVQGLVKYRSCLHLNVATHDLRDISYLL